MSIGAIIGWIIIGLIAGALGKLIMPGDDPGGIIVTIILGIAGAFIGGFLASLIGIGGGGVIWTIIIATIGAIILLAIYRAVVGGRTARR
ncbi:MAG TPA: GlsB/YeaQ/YmgE family stress response membrane protein [Rubrobacteraceae bacterium]|nr:GlsB/YeaQ/YmgE family stress response membrane protein [Rubrobacteraceae bacterium]